MATPINITPLPNINQLPVTAVHRIFQDRKGYMWYGTVEGLCRDDAYQIIPFRTESRSGKPVTNNPVTSILESPSGDIWFGTDNGAYILHTDGYYISSLNSELCLNRRTEVVGVASDSSIFVAVSGKLMKFKSDGSLQKSYDIPLPATIADMIETPNRKIWFSTWKSPLLCLHMDNDTLTFAPETPEINCMTLSHDGKHLWLGSSSGKIFLYNTNPGHKEKITQVASDRSGKPIYYIVQDNNDGSVWTTTEHGLNRYECHEDNSLIPAEIGDDTLNGSMMLSEIIKDRKGNLWVSAFDRPSFCIQMQPFFPQHYPMNQAFNLFNNNASVIAMAKGKDGHIWFSQERSGLCLFNPSNDKITFYKNSHDISHLPLNSIVEMTASGDGSKVWLTPVESQFIFRFHETNGNISLSDSLSISGLDDTTISKLWEDRNGILWIGTGKSLITYNPADKSIKLVSGKIGKVSDIRESILGHIWIATSDKGIWSASSDGKLRRWQGTDISSIVSLSPSAKGDVWFATEEGDVLMFSPKTMLITSAEPNIPLRRCSINHIHVDGYGHVWIIQNQEIIEFNPSNGSYHIYLTSDFGMPWRILPTSFFIDDERNIFVGGIPGVSKLSPSPRLEYEPSNLKTVISDVHVGGKSIIMGDSLTENSSREIFLNPDDQYIEIFFSSFNHLYAEKTRYEYRLLGFDKHWIKLDHGKNVASFSRLPHGSFTLEVRATDENDQWSTSITTLRVNRRPAFYETWWFRTLIALFIISVAGGGIFIYIKTIKRKNEEIWEDSAEMKRMYDYIKSTDDGSDPQYEEMDKILLQKINIIIEDNLAEIDFSVEILARKMNMSRSTLTRKLKTATGLTPLEYIRRFKMRHAKAMLSDKGRSVSDVAYALGYDNPKYFTACFKSAFGMTPSEYQKVSANEVADNNQEASFDSK